MWSAMKKRLRASRFVRDQSGLGAVEFAFTAPVVIMLILGTTELGQYILKNQSLGAAAARIGDVITREEALSEEALTQFIGTIKHVAASEDFEESGFVIVSAVTGVSQNSHRISWQVSGGGELEAASSIGRQNGAATLPENVSIAAGETLIAVEVFYHYDGLFSGVYENLFGNALTPVGTLRKTAWFRGRKNDLDQLCRNGNPGTGNNGNCGNVNNPGNTGANGGQRQI